MVKAVRESKNWTKAYKGIDGSFKEQVDKLLKKIIEDPETGKPMKFGRKGTREVYVGPFRLSYAYVSQEDILYLLDLYHKDKQ